MSTQICISVLKYVCVCQYTPPPLLTLRYLPPNPQVSHSTTERYLNQTWGIAYGQAN